MFVGHTAIALIATRRYPAVPLGGFLVATFALDLVWPVCLLLGIEQVRIERGATAFGPLVFVSYPWSHSLLMALVWGAFGAAIARWRRFSTADAIAIGLVVVSHWVLDVVTHVPDLQLAPGLEARVGLGLWRSIPATLAVEGAFFVVAIYLYVTGTRPRDRIGVWGLWSFLLVSAAVWASGPWSAAPPDTRSLAWFAMGIWLLIAWGAWGGRHRVPASSPDES